MLHKISSEKNKQKPGNKNARWWKLKNAVGVQNSAGGVISRKVEKP